MSMGHHHSHSSLAVPILLNIAIAVAQAVGGVMTGSLSLLSDALHNLSDVVALVVSFIARRLAHRKATSAKTFGYKRAEILAALINAVVLVGVGGIIIIEAIHRFSAPPELDPTWVIILSAASIGVNLGSVFWIAKEAKESLNMKSAYLHLLSDAGSSLAVLLGALAMKYYGWFWLDAVLAVCVAVILIGSSWGLISKTIAVLMQFSPPDIDLKDIESEILSLDEIEGVHHIHLWQLTENECHFEAHIHFRDDLMMSRVEDVLGRVKGLLMFRFGVSHVTLQPELNPCGDHGLVVEKE